MTAQSTLAGGTAPWLIVRDGDPRARALADRHYSRKTVGARLFCGPGEKIVLLSPDGKALFVWRRSKPGYRLDHQIGVECTIFRNEGPTLSSDLIRSAEEIARSRWPGERLFTYIDPTAIKSLDPGHCFIMAGWDRCEWKSRDRGLLLLEKTGAAP